MARELQGTQRKKMFEGQESQTLRQAEETASSHTHALEVLGQWQELQSTVERLKATSDPPREPDPQIAA